VPDPIRDLEQFPTEGLAVNPLSPADVRRRGDRMRRRRHAATALAGAAAVALVVVPLAVFAGGNGERSEQPPVATSPANPGEVPDGFPLTAGWPEEGTDPHLVGPAHDAALADDFLVCDRPLPRPAFTDVLSAELHDVEDEVQFRWLTTYADPRAARQAVAGVRAAWEACPREATVPGNTPTAEWRHRVADVTLAGAAADSFGVGSELTTATGEGIGRQTRYVSLRVGRAVLSGMWWTHGSEPDPGARDALVQAMAEDAAVPVAAMCTWAEDPCSRQPEQSAQPDPSEQSPGRDGDWLDEIPEGFRLLVGVDNDPEGSTPTVSPDAAGLAAVGLCGREVWPAESVDRLAGEDPALDHHWQRELLLFPSDAEAKAAMARVRDALAGCPREPSTDPAVPDLESDLVHTSHPGDSGAEEAVTWTDAYANGAIGTRVFQFVRVGNAVTGSVVDSESNIDGVADQLPMVEDQARPLVAEMCVFAAEPCGSTEPAPGGGSGGAAGESRLGDSNLVRAGELPRLEGMPWQQVEAQAVPTLTCQGAWLSSLDAAETVSREFRIRAESAGADLGVVNTAVLRFPDRAAATRAYDTVWGWLRECPGTHAPTRPTVNEPVAPVQVDTGPDIAPVDRAHRVLVAWQPPDFCPEGCDMAYFDHQTVAQVGSYLVLVSEAEAAGPCAPGDACPETEESTRPWKDRVDEVTRLVVGRGVGHLH